MFKKWKLPQDSNEVDTMFLTDSYEKNKKMFHDSLRVETNFDIIERDLMIGSQKATYYFVDGLSKDEVMEKILEFFINTKDEDFAKWSNPYDFIQSRVPYIESDVQKDFDQSVTLILSGALGLLIESYDAMIFLDIREYPTRSIEEPDDDKVLRGSHDGFNETLIFNTALIRRRLRDPSLTMEYHQLAKQSCTDVVLCYMKEKADLKLLKKLRKKLDEITIDNLTLSQESLAECLLEKQLYNPLPRIRYSERPDSTAASIIEGSIAILIDNSPSAMILPTSFFDFLQDTNDFYFPPFVGTYLRMIRLCVFFLTLFLTPIWFLCVKNPDWLSPSMQFLLPESNGHISILFQLLIIEFIVDGLKLASLNTPSALSNSFSILGAIILGDFAVKANLFIPQVVLYMCFVAITTFTQPSIELGYAFKFFRIMLLILTELFNVWGFIGGVALILLALFTTKTLNGRCYLYPLIPFDATACSRLFFRRSINKHNS